MSVTHRRTTICIGYLVVLAGLWAWLTWSTWSGPSRHTLKGIGAATGVAGYLCLSLSLLLASRFPLLEKCLGGLDQIYAVHRWVGIAGLVFVVVHPVIFAIRQLPHHVDRFFLMLLPLHNRTSVNLGSYAFWLMIVIMVVTLLKLMAYNRWKHLHKLMSVVFILVSLHLLLSSHRFGPPSSLIVLCIPLGVGLASIVYKQIVLDGLISHPQYAVTGVAHLNEQTVKIELKPTGGPLKFTPGQYAFFSFRCPHATREYHPFTLLGKGDGNTISIVVKGRGDYTNQLTQTIAKGDRAVLEGPYGRFDTTKGQPKQIWIGGGIGIAPFLEWARLIKPDQEIDLYYCTHTRKEAIELDLLQKTPQLNLFFYCSEEENRITARDIQKHSPHLLSATIFMCGPKRMTQDLTRQLTHLGVRRHDVVFEDFEFY